MEQKHNLEDLMEKRLELLTKTVNKRKRKKTDSESYNAEDSNVSFALFEAEKIKVKVRKIHLSLIIFLCLVRGIIDKNYLQKTNSIREIKLKFEVIKYFIG